MAPKKAPPFMAKGKKPAPKKAAKKSVMKAKRGRR